MNGDFNVISLKVNVIVFVKYYVLSYNRHIICLSKTKMNGDFNVISLKVNVIVFVKYYVLS